MKAKQKWSATKIWQRIRTVPGLGRDVGALLVVVVLGLASTGVILSQMNYSWPWETGKFRFQVEFGDAVAISPSNGQEVRIAGVEVGDVLQATPSKQNTSLVSLTVAPEHVIYDNARAVLRPKNPLNEMYVEINPGGPPGKPLPPDGVIPLSQTERPVQPEEVFNHLDERSRNALSVLLSESDVALSNGPQTLPGGLRATDNMLTNVKPVVDALATRRQNIQQLVTAMSQVSTAAGRNDQRLTSLIDSTQDTLGVLAHRDDQVNDSLNQLGGVTDELKNAMQHTSDLTAQANPLLDNVKTASDQLPPALERMQSTVDQLGRTVQAAKPVVHKAGPVVADLRPVVGNLNDTLGNIKPVSKQLGYATAQIAPWMYDLGAFTYNTNSVFSGSDANGGFGRGQVTVDVERPLGVPKPGDEQKNSFRQGESPLGPYPAPGEGG